MLEAGLIDEWKLRTWMRMKAESKDEQIQLEDVKTLEPLHLDDIQGVFIIYALSIVASVATFVYEVTCYRRNKRLVRF